MNQVDNNSAKIKMTKVKDSVVDESTATCFCDSACLDLGDCCLDYITTCPPVDCVLDNNWSTWSDCDVRCGPGIKQRVRQVVQAPLNGGRPCPGNTIEKAVCEGTSCKIARAPQGHEELRETGKIIPAAYGPWRKDKIYNPYEDIRKNLFEHYENQTVFNRPSYCMQFELTEVRPTCAKSTTSLSTVDQNIDETWTQRLVKGATICVECQSVAMHRKLGARCRGHGVMLKETRWSAVATTTGGCHGKWVMKSREQGCQCASDSPQSFILI